MRNLSLSARAIFPAIAFFLAVCFVNLAEAETGYCMNANVTDISPTSVGLDEEFTVGIVIENCGDVIPESATFELKDISPDIRVKESLIKEMGKLGYSDSERFLLYHMKTSANATPGTYLIKYVLSYTSQQFSFKEEGNFSITVTGEEAELNLASVKTKPVLPRQGETVELTLRIENVGEGDAKSIKVYSDYPFKGVKQSFIGSLEPNEDAPAIFTFIADKPGEFKFPVTITYSDDFGAKETKTDVEISVIEKKSDLGTIMLIVFIVIVFGLIIFYLLRKNKAKDNTIAQLLRNETFDKKNKK